MSTDCLKPAYTWMLWMTRTPSNRPDPRQHLHLVESPILGSEFIGLNTSLHTCRETLVNRLNFDLISSSLPLVHGKKLLERSVTQFLYNCLSLISYYCATSAMQCHPEGCTHPPPPFPPCLQRFSGDALLQPCILKEL